MPGEVKLPSGSPNREGASSPSTVAPGYLTSRDQFSSNRCPPAARLADSESCAKFRVMGRIVDDDVSRLQPSEPVDSFHRDQVHPSLNDELDNRPARDSCPSPRCTSPSPARITLMPRTFRFPLRVTRTRSRRNKSVGSLTQHFLTPSSTRAGRGRYDCRRRGRFRPAFRRRRSGRRHRPLPGPGRSPSRPAR